jgi:hypothetical protein
MSKSSKGRFKYPIVVITWDDAESDDGWAETPEELEPKLATSVGFLIRQTEKYILLAMSYDNGHTNGRFQIPKALIKEQKEIK